MVQSRLAVLVALSFLAACSPATPYQCEVPDTAAVFLKLDGADCSVVQENFANAKQVLTNAGLVPAEKWTEIYSNTVFIVEDTYALSGNIAGYGQVGGYQEQFTGNTHVDCMMRSLAHELLHQYDSYRGDGFMTTFHPGWGSNGYDEAADEYTLRRDIQIASAAKKMFPEGSWPKEAGRSIGDLPCQVTQTE